MPMNIASKIDIAEIGKSINHVCEINTVCIRTETIAVETTELIATVIKRCNKTLDSCFLANRERIIEPTINEGNLK